MIVDILYKLKRGKLIKNFLKSFKSDFVKIFNFNLKIGLQILIKQQQK